MERGRPGGWRPWGRGGGARGSRRGWRRRAQPCARPRYRLDHPAKGKTGRIPPGGVCRPFSRVVARKVIARVPRARMAILLPPNPTTRPPRRRGAAACITYSASATLAVRRCTVDVRRAAVGAVWPSPFLAPRTLPPLPPPSSPFSRRWIAMAAPGVTDGAADCSSADTGTGGGTGGSTGGAGGPVLPVGPASPCWLPRLLRSVKGNRSERAATWMQLATVAEGRPSEASSSHTLRCGRWARSAVSVCGVEPPP
jgi:hypothetical protein